MWIQGKALSAIEASIMSHLPGEDAAGAIRAAADRTRDLLPVAVKVVELLIDGESVEMGARADRLLVQLELGVSAPMVPLAKLAGTRLGRGDYLALDARGLRGPASLAAASDVDIETLLGSKEKVRVVRECEARMGAEADATCDFSDTMPDVFEEARAEND